jgi:hypothetical protein
MAIVKIDQVHLYTGLTETASDSYAAKKWMDDNGVEYIHLHYGDETQHEVVFSALSTWWPTESVITQFPFVTYREIHDDYSTINLSIRGLEAITESNLVELQKLG